MLQSESLLTRKISAFIHLSEGEKSYLSELQSTPVLVKRGKELVREGESGSVAYILQAGWACSFKLLADGGRQVITFPVPGDCVGLRSMLLRTSDHSLTAVTDAWVTRLEAGRVKKMFADYPYLATAILWATSRDEAMIVEHLVSIGRRNALERTAHLVLELYDRLQLVGLASGDEFTCPLNQYIMADALGLSTIHVNRVLRTLRDRALLTFRDHRMIIHDFAGLKSLAGYQSANEGPVVLLERSSGDVAGFDPARPV